MEQRVASSKISTKLMKMTFFSSNTRNWNDTAENCFARTIYSHSKISWCFDTFSPKINKPETFISVQEGSQKDARNYPRMDFVPRMSVKQVKSS